MTQRDNPFKDWDTRTVDSPALWMPMAAAVLSLGVGVIAICHGDYWTGVLAILAGFTSAAGVWATGEASRKRDGQRDFWVGAIGDIDRNRE